MICFAFVQEQRFESKYPLVGYLTDGCRPTSTLQETGKTPEQWQAEDSRKSR